MIGDAMVDERGSEEGTGVIPALKPILVAADQDVDALIRTARANIARLSLELRVVLNDATVAEREGVDIESGSTGSDLIAAREFLRTALEPRIEERRRELAARIEEERADAARRIEAAQIEAAALVDSARAELLAVLLKGTQSHPAAPVGPAAPVDPAVRAAPANLRIIANRVFPADHPAGSNGNDATVAANGNSSTVAEPTVAEPTVEDQGPAPGAEVATADPQPQTVEPAIPVTRERQARRERPVPLDRKDRPVTRERQARQARRERPVKLDREDRPVTREPQARQARRERPVKLDRKAQFEAPVDASQANELQTTSKPELSEAEPKQGKAYWTKFLYLDVALPLIAVLVVTIVLLAWLG